MVCPQESKLSHIEDFLIPTLWGPSPCGYSFQASAGASGSLLTLWDTSVVEVWCTLSLRHILVIKGRVILTGQEFIIANIYAPCDVSSKEILWVRLSEFILNIGDANLCICGDFNSVRTANERRVM